jgi:glucose/arabinose dehydrogenase
MAIASDRPVLKSSLLKLPFKLVLRKVSLMQFLFPFLLIACKTDESSVANATAAGDTLASESKLTKTAAGVLDTGSETPEPLSIPSTIAADPLEADSTLSRTEQPTEDVQQSTPTQSPTALPMSTAAASATPVFEPVSTITVKLIAEGFSQPTFLTHSDDSRLFVSEQAGRIWVLVNGQKLERPFLDISLRVRSDALEQGLLSVAFHPEFAANGYFYVNYSDVRGDTVVARYTVLDDEPNLADPDSEVILMTVDQPYANHNGGQLQFGPDGFMYVGMGDGGSAGDPGNHGQNPSTLLGAMLRIDVDGPAPYSIPADNPYLEDDAVRDEIWATGLRNPWRFSFDQLTGDLYIADVGQNMWEEINFQPARATGGVNYGWNVFEGSSCYSQSSCADSEYVMPIAEYSHTEGGCSITGGYVYRGQAHPSLRGNYFFADYCLGNVWSLFPNPAGHWEMTQVARLGVNISSFGEDAAGEVYFLDHVGGAIYQIQP